MRVVLIPARGGSKRIPRKNIRLFAGKPMIAWSIEAAIACGVADRVIVSTDDPEIAAVAKNFGAEVPFIRPSQLADDYATTMDVVQHAIGALADRGDHIESLCCLYATAPFVRPQDLAAAYDALVNEKFSYSFSVTTYSFPVQRALRINAQGGVTMLNPEYLNTRSQDLEEIYHDAGQFYWGRREAFSARIPIFSAAAFPYVLPRYRVQDIDTLEDWRRAELMHAALSAGADD